MLSDNSKYKSWWWRDMQEVYGKDVKGNWFDENVLWKIGGLENHPS